MWKWNACNPWLLVNMITSTFKVSECFRYVQMASWIRQTEGKQDFLWKLSTRILSYQSPLSTICLDERCFLNQLWARTGSRLWPTIFIVHQADLTRSSHETHAANFVTYVRWWWQLASWVIVRCCSTDFRCWDKLQRKADGLDQRCQKWMLTVFFSLRFPGWRWI